MSSSSTSTSKTITGGCLCESVRYKIAFPEDHDFSKDSLGCICQCTQCRKQTGSFFLPTITVSLSTIEWQGHSEDDIKKFHATENISRGFCQNCGSFIYWHPHGKKISIATGSIDPLYLFGEGAQDAKGGVPKEGFAREIFSGHFNVEFCESEIKGVTDDIPILHKGNRAQGDSAAI